MKHTFILLMLLAVSLSAVQRNLLRNPSFEAIDGDGKPVNWLCDKGRANATVALYSQEAHSGQHCIRMVNPSPYGAHIFGSLSQGSITLQAGVPYTISFYVKSKDTGKCWFGGGNGWKIRFNLNKSYPEWTRVVKTFTPKPDDLPFHFRVNTDDITEEILLDDFQLEQGTVATEFMYEKPLQPGEARITLEEQQDIQNLLSNGSFETLSAVRPQDWIWDKRNTDSTFEIVKDDAPDGANYLRFTNKTAFGPHVYFWFGHLGDVTVKPNSDYTIALLARCKSGNTCWFGGGHGWKHRKMIPNTDGQWRRIVFTFTTDATHTSFPVMIVGERPCESLEVDDILFTEGKHPELEYLPVGLKGNAIHMIAQPPQPTEYRNSSYLARWDTAHYPVESWLFPAGNIVSFTGAATVEKSGADTVLEATAVADNGAILAQTSKTLPTNGSNSWTVELQLRLKDALLRKFTLKSVLKQNGTAIATEEKQFNCVNAVHLNQFTADIRAKRDAYAARLASLNYPEPNEYSLALQLTDRFLGYISSDITSQNLDRAWFTLNKLQAMLEQSNNELDAIAAGRRTAPLPVPMYQTSPITIDKTVLRATAKLPDGTVRQNAPIFFSGYGHFNQVRKDIELFASYGLNCIQIEHGPSGTLVSENEVSMVAINQLLAVCDRAEKANVSIMLLLSPHYFPQWALDKWPELKLCQGGFFHYCTHSPDARSVIEKYLRIIIPAIKDCPAIHSLCLSNEPLCLDSTNCPIVKANWPKWLAKRHGTIETLNACWATTYKSFDEVEIPKPFPKTPIAYDYMDFNQECFAEFHQWMADVVHSMAPHIPVHAKIMMAAHWNHGPSGIWSVSPERFAELSQLNGNDNCCWPVFNGTWASSWQRYLMGADFQRSMKDIAIADTENHIIFDRSFYDLPANHTYAALFQGVLHGRTASTTWVWERTNSQTSDLAGSILNRPLHVLAHSKATMDVNRLADEITAIQRRPPQVALYWSQATVTYNEYPHLTTLNSIWTTLAHLDQQQAFVSEYSLAQIAAAGNLPEHLKALKVLFIPDVANTTATALKGLDVIRRNNVKIITVNSPITKDEYNRPLHNPPVFDTIRLTDTADALQPALLKALQDNAIPTTALAVDGSGTPAYGIEIHSAVYNGKTIVTLCNQTREAIDATLTVNGKAVTATNMLTGETLAGKQSFASQQPLVLIVK